VKTSSLPSPLSSVCPISRALLMGHSRRFRQLHATSGYPPKLTVKEEARTDSLGQLPPPKPATADSIEVPKAAATSSAVCARRARTLLCRPSWPWSDPARVSRSLSLTESDDGRSTGFDWVILSDRPPARQSISKGTLEGRSMVRLAEARAGVHRP
jgi:hypothetical protein